MIRKTPDSTTRRRQLQRPPLRHPQLQRRVLCLALWTTALGACTDKVQAPPQRPASDRLAEAVLGPGPECKRSAECASGVCSDGFCVALLDASQLWMEHTIGLQVRAMAQDNPHVIDTLLNTWAPRFEDEDPFVRGRFAGMLGALGDPHALPLLRQWSHATTERVRVRATLARCQIQDPKAASDCLDLISHRSEAVALAAMDLVVGYGAPDQRATRPAVIQTLLDALERGRSHRIRQRAIRRLGQVAQGSQAAVAALEAVLKNDADAFLHRDATRALAAIRGLSP